MSNSRNMQRLHLLISSFIFLALLVPSSSSGAETSASGVIKNFNSTLLECMKKAKKLDYTGRYKLLEPVVKDSFALSYMVTLSAGRYWKTLSEKQQRLLQDTYAEWSVATYAGRFDEYSGQKFEVVSESKPAQGAVTVVSKMIDPGGEEIDFYYKLKKMDGRWHIVDIQISGVSQLALTRSQFVSVLGSKGFDGLISSLREKIENFAQSKRS